MAAFSLDGDNAIAIIGAGCKLPGADNLEEFWKVLKNGENHIKPVPADRWSLDAYYDKSFDTPGKTYIHQAGFLDNPHAFDNTLFGISDVEAAKMDPQQKWVLECTYRALEDAGIPMESVSGSDTGVFIGVMNTDYNSIVNESCKDIDAYHVTAGEQSILSARVSYIFNLLGPSMTISTGCSSAMTCVHLGLQAIRNGDCNMAICGGVNAMLNPKEFIALSKARMGSPTGQSQAFSQYADGYARAEGCGIVILKRLEKAMADGDNIWATVGTGINQDGQTTTPMTAPSGDQQAVLLQRVHNQYGVAPESIDYFEAHGTGTPRGDPIEVNAIGRVIGKAKSLRGLGPCRIGSVKTNIGHTEAAAGVASLIKVLLMMNKKEIVPSLFSEKLNENIAFDKLHLAVATESYKWSSKENHIAGINSFGYGGSNAYAIVKQFAKSSPRHETSRKHSFIVLSAPQEHQLHKLVNNVKKQCREHQTPEFLRTLSYVTTTRRSNFRHRIAFYASSTEELATKLERPISNHSAKKEKLHIIFLFNGMGTNWPGMCKELMMVEPIIRGTIQEIDSYLSNHVNWSLEKVLSESHDIQSPEIIQPAIFAVQVAVARLWTSLGIVPDAVLGHSVGEVAASYCSGYLSMEDAVKVIYHRGRLLSKESGGKMLVVSNYPLVRIKELLKGYENHVEIAAFNSSTSCTLSGDAEYIDELNKRLLHEAGEDVFIRELKVNTAFHSHHVEPILQELRQCLNQIGRQNPSNKLVSTVTGFSAAQGDYVTSQYWCLNVRQPVLFEKAFREAADDVKINIVFEIGPRSVLRGAIQQILPRTKFHHLPSMRSTAELECFHSSLCEAYKLGLQIDWKHYNKENLPVPQNVAILPFEHKEIYFEPDEWKKKKAGSNERNQAHPFIYPNHATGTSFSVEITENTTPFVFDHRVWNKVVPPGALYAEVVVGCIMMIPQKTWLLKDLSTSVYFHKKIELQTDDKVQMTAEVKQSEKELEVTVQHEGSTCAIGKVTVREKLQEERVNLSDIKVRCPNIIDGSTLYERLRKAHFAYGPTLTLVVTCHHNERECLVNLKVPDKVVNELKHTYLHPAILDGLMQSMAVFDFFTNGNSFMLPVYVEGIKVHGFLERELRVILQIHQLGDAECILSGIICNRYGSILVSCERIRLASMAQESLMHQVSYVVEWVDKTDDFLKKQTVRHNSKFFIIYENKPDGERLQGSLENEFNRSQIVHCSYNSKLLLDKLHAFSNLSAESSVVVYLMTEPFHEEQSPSEVHENVIYSKCQTLGKVVKELQQFPTATAVYVITRNSHLDELCGENANIYNSALWGYTRSVMAESTLAIALVDIEGDSDGEFSSLSQFIQRYLPSSPEWKLKEGQFLTNQVFHLMGRGEGSKGREQTLDSSVQISLMSEGKGKNYHLIYQVLPQDKQDTHNVRLIACVDPNGEVPLTATDSLAETCVFGPKNIIVLDSVGNIRKKHPGDRQGILQAILYPVSCSTWVSVPGENMIDVSLLPQGTPLHLSKLLILQIMSKIVTQSKKNHIFVLVGEKSLSDWEQMMFVILRYLNGNRKITKTSSLTNHGQYSMDFQSSILIATSTAHVETILVEKNISKCIPVITVQEYVGCASIQRLESAGFKIVNIQLKHMFSPANLRATVPALFKWLKSSKNFPNVSLRQKIIRLQEKPSIENSREENVKLTKFSAVIAYKDTLFRQNAKYILVGGLQGLGWLLAEHMAIENAGVLICVSRSAPTREKIESIVALERKTGVQILWAQCDVSNFMETKQMLSKVRKVMPEIPLKGIFHSAVVYADKVFTKMTQNEFLKVTGPKVRGAWNLHLLTTEDKLDYFVLHSSVAALFGNAGQSNYSAANGFLDGLAYYRRVSGLPGQSICWGPLKTGVLERNELTEEILKSQGWKVLEKHTINHCFQYALLGNKPYSIFFDADFGALADTLDASCVFSGGTVREDRLLGPRIGEKMKEILTPLLNKHEVADAVFEDNQGDCHDALKTMVSSVTGVPEADIKEDVPLLEVGVNSMHATILRGKIRKRFRTNVAIEQILQDQTTIRTLADVLSMEFNLPTGSQGVPVSAPTRPLSKADTSHKEKSELNIIANGHLNSTESSKIAVQTEDFLKETQRGSSHRRTLQLKEEGGKLWLQWTNGRELRVLRLKDITSVSLYGTSGMRLTTKTREYRFIHQRADRTADWVNLLEVGRRIDLFMAEKMLWADKSSQVSDEPAQSYKAGDDQDRLTLMDKSKGLRGSPWRSLESVFSIQSSISYVPNSEVTNL